MPSPGDGDLQRVPGEPADLDGRGRRRAARCGPSRSARQAGTSPAIAGAGPSSVGLDRRLDPGPDPARRAVAERPASRSAVGSGEDLRRGRRTGPDRVSASTTRPPGSSSRRPGLGGATGRAGRPRRPRSSGGPGATRPGPGRRRRSPGAIRPAAGPIGPAPRAAARASVPRSCSVAPGRPPCRPDPSGRGGRVGTDRVPFGVTRSSHTGSNSREKPENRGHAGLRGRSGRKCRDLPFPRLGPKSMNLRAIPERARMARRIAAHGPAASDRRDPIKREVAATMDWGPLLLLAVGIALPDRTGRRGPDAAAGIVRPEPARGDGRPELRRGAPLLLALRAEPSRGPRARPRSSSSATAGCRPTRGSTAPGSPT